MPHRVPGACCQLSTPESGGSLIYWVKKIKVMRIPKITLSIITKDIHSLSKSKPGPMMSLQANEKSLRMSSLSTCDKWFSSIAQSCPTLCNPMDCSTPGLPLHHQIPEFIQTHVHWVGDAIQPSHPLLSPSPPAFNLSQHQGLFKWALHVRWPKYWSFSFSTSPSNEYPGWSSFRMDRLGLLAVLETTEMLGG